MPPRLQVRPLSAVLLLALLQPALSSFFLPNGTDVSAVEKFAAPCSSSSSDSLRNIVCQTKWGNPPGGDAINGPTRDECMPNGLCRNRGFSTKPGQESAPWTDYYRVYCTDRDWKGCLDICSTGNNANFISKLTPCDGTATSDKWCCGDTTDCCTPEFAYKAVYIPQTFSNTSSAASNGPPTTSSGNPPSNKLSAGAGVGIGLVVGVVIAVGVFVVAFLVKRRNSKKFKIMEKGGGADVKSNRWPQSTTVYRHEAGSRPELSGQDPHRTELDGALPVHELYASSVHIGTGSR